MFFRQLVPASFGQYSIFVVAWFCSASTAGIIVPSASHTMWHCLVPESFHFQKESTLNHRDVLGSYLPGDE